MPISVTGNLEFLSYMHEVNPKHVVPGRNQAADDVKVLAMDAKQLLFELMIGALSKIHLTIDIWSKKGLTSSYLGVTAQFLIVKEVIRQGKKVKIACIEDCVLELIEFPNPHTGVRIATELLRIIKKAWDIKNRLGFVLSDSGANVIKAFKDAQRMLNEEEQQSNESETAVLNAAPHPVTNLGQNEAVLNVQVLT